MVAPTKPQKARRGITRQTNQQFKKSLMDHVHPAVWSLCALIFVLGQTLQNLGFNVSAPANRLASAYARGYELEVEQRIRTGQPGVTIEPIGTEDLADLRLFM